jgi:hypothetical protein
MFQMFSRNNDANGNPYRLMLVYGESGEVVEAYEARSSCPNQIRVLRNKGLTQLPTFHLQPSEYNQTRKAYQDRLAHVS